MKTVIGGDRLGSGNKQNVSIKNFERSTHDMSYLWRSSMSAGTLVPFMSELALPGDSWDIDLNCEVMTLPTVGPLFGSFKVQLDVFECPIRLYNGKLHMNMLNIGLDMSKILLPQLSMKAHYDPNNLDENAQINPSSIYAYLNIRGLGRKVDGTAGEVSRDFNAVPYLAYWDIYKQYYSNKQEERGFVIHRENFDNSFPIEGAQMWGVPSGSVDAQWVDIWDNGIIQIQTSTSSSLKIFYTAQAEEGTPNVDDVFIEINGDQRKATDFWNDYRVYHNTGEILFFNYIGGDSQDGVEVFQQSIKNSVPSEETFPNLVEFPLENIDNMRMEILADVKSITPFIVDAYTYTPYRLGLKKIDNKYTKLSSQEGLGIKTYQSDLFNNWISTEWIDGNNGINAITSVSTAGDSFTIDALNLANKVYNMLNRIAISGGDYDSWIDAQYTHERMRSVENPIYHGSLIKELAFEEVISTTDTLNIEQSTDQPLGTLAGRGRLTNKNKGGSIRIKVNEPAYLIGIVSLTPRVDYSQGNKWDMNLKNMNELHVPSLDAIGYQDLVTDQMAWFDTTTTSEGVVGYKSAGKQPAWINYMTNVNIVRGNFAIQNKEMFMTLNRRYEQGTTGIKDLTTYIDPSKFNFIFAQTSLDSQNFWVQISNNAIARRKMSAKVIPNL